MSGFIGIVKGQTEIQKEPYGIPEKEGTPQRGSATNQKHKPLHQIQTGIIPRTNIWRSIDTIVDPMPHANHPPQGDPEGAKLPAKKTARRSTRNRTTLNHLVQAMLAELSIQPSPFKIFSLQAQFLMSTDHELQDTLNVHKATADSDTMYHHQAMKELDAENFKEAMKDKFNAQVDGKVLQLVKRDTVPEGATLLPSVWHMRRKRHIKTQEVYKWKARLNIDRSRMVYQQDYDQIYAQVASSNSIRLLLILTLIHVWSTKQLDSVLAFMQAPEDRDLYMKVPKVFEV